VTTLVALLRDVVSLFVDDGSLALAIMGVVAIAAFAATLTPNAPLLAGAVLLMGSLGVLVVNVMRAARH
jgi:hypothetical protein